MNELFSNIGCGENEKDCFKTFVHLLPKSGNADDLKMFFLKSCKSGHLDVVKSFFENEGENKVSINAKDSEDKSCLYYVADGMEDNYDVVDFLLLNQDNRSGKQNLSKVLFYFIKKESVTCSKLKSIKEIIKRTDRINFYHTDNEGILWVLFYRSKCATPHH